MERRNFLKTGAGGLIVYFSLPVSFIARGQEKITVPEYAVVDAWLAIDTDGAVTVFTGKVELGTGVETALSQIVADELDVGFEQVRLVMGDTARCPDQFPTVGSLTIYRAGPQLRQAAAEARVALVDLGAAHLGVPGPALRTGNGSVTAADGRSLSYAALVGGRPFERSFTGSAPLKPLKEYKLVGTSVPRVEIPPKVQGLHTFIHDLRIPGMLHGAVIRSPIPGATPAVVRADALDSLHGNPRLVRHKNFIGVVAEGELEAAHAAEAIEVDWSRAPALPGSDEIPDLLRRIEAADSTLVENGDVAKTLDSAATVLSASYYAPYQLHASIAPSCAIADVRKDSATLWSATQSSFPLRNSLAALLVLPPEQVRLIWIEGAGCYGHNGADDATADAALLSQKVGRPVRVQYSRCDENRWEPKGLAMAMEVRGALDSNGAMHAFDYQVWSANHISARPFAAGNLLAGAETGHGKREVLAGADRNATHAYRVPNYRAVLHLLQSNPLRCSSFRGLGSPQNAFANEAFVDELAAAAGADPLNFRLDHLDDERAIAVLEEVARLSNWEKRPSPSPDRSDAIGRGLAFVQYANYSAYVAMVIEVGVDRASGKVRTRRVWVAHDCGLIVNPDGVRNQIEGNVIQTLSRALFEELHFDESGLNAADWVEYPIMSLADAPQEVVISLISRPDQESLGAGEPAASPVFAALANAIFDATGVRLRRIPFTPDRVKQALS